MEDDKSVDVIAAAAFHATALEEKRTSDVDRIVNALAILQLGQEKTNDHLARLNGSVAEHQRELTTLMLWKAQAEGFGKAIGAGWSALITLLSGGLVTLIYFVFRK